MNLARLESFVLALAAVLALGQGRIAEAQTPAPVPIVVELFTSQGCNSCPPADAFLAELAARPGVLALSFHVDYWDYIGWKDPFAQRAFTERQRSYAKALSTRYVYTPQLVVDGKAQEVGSDRKAVERTLTRIAAERPRRLSLQLRREGGRSSVAIDNPEEVAMPTDRPAHVWFVVYDRRQSTRVARGENAGKTLDNVNVVRRFEKLGIYAGRTVALPVELGGEAGQGRVVIVQAGHAGAILGVLPLDSAASP